MYWKRIFKYLPDIEEKRGRYTQNFTGREIFYASP